MIEALKRLFVALVWWEKPEQENVEVKKKSVTLDETREDVETSGKWYSLKDLLDNAGEYFYWMRRLKTHDLDMYHLFSALGGQIVHPNGHAHNKELDPSFFSYKGAPRSVGLVSVLHEDHEDNDKLTAKLIYYQKIEWADVQPFSGDRYAVTCFLARKDDKFAVPAEFYVGVGTDRKCSVLKARMTRRQNIGNGHVVNHTEWGFPPVLEAYADENGFETESAGLGLFYLCANASVFSSGGAQVRLQKRDVVGVFTVPITRTRHFFSDREPVYSQTGTKKRIFHIVRTHKRLGKAIKSHFRGLRKFKWNDFNVNIIVEGKHVGAVWSDYPKSLNAFDYRKKDREKLADFADYKTKVRRLLHAA